MNASSNCARTATPPTSAWRLSAPATGPSTSTEVSLRLESLHEHVEQDLGVTTTDEVVGLAVPDVPENTTVAHAAELVRKLSGARSGQPPGPRGALHLEERHKELEVQVDDVRAPGASSTRSCGTLDHEIMTSFAAAAADVNEHFSTLVALLFPGGTGRLVLTEPDDLLNTGVEIEVRPAGRNVRRVSLLSGASARWRPWRSSSPSSAADPRPST